MSFGVVGGPNAFKGDREPRLSRQPGYGSKQTKTDTDVVKTRN